MRHSEEKKKKGKMKNENKTAYLQDNGQGGVYSGMSTLDVLTDAGLD